MLRPGRALICGCLVAASLLAACASTRVETTGSPLGEALCRAGRPSIPTLVYWGSKWRPEQEDVALREAAALRGIASFLDGAGCLSVVAIRRLGPAQVAASNAELMRLAAEQDVRAGRILFIVVRELGPRLVVGIPGVVQGGTEVLVDVRVLDASTSAQLASTQTLWRNGGSLVDKGGEALDQDMSAALRSVLLRDRDGR